MSGSLIYFPRSSETLPPEEAGRAVERILREPLAERLARCKELSLEDPELLLALCNHLHSRLETAPAEARQEAEFFYRFLEQPERSIGAFDEREFFLGELALTVGTACRVLFRREESRVWLDRAEANFVLAQNAGAQVARVAYQRLALRLEERQYDEVLEFAPFWSRIFAQLGLSEESLKCLFLEGLARWESGEAERAIEIYAQILSAAQATGNRRLSAQASNNLVHFYSTLGRSEEALAYSRVALPLLRELENRVGLAKLQWSIGDLLRAEGKLPGALEAYRSAQKEVSEIGLRGDSAALHLIVADVLLDLAQDAQAEWELRAALPIIDEERMVPEGLAALSLLRESMRRRAINRQALRDLHGYFRN